MVERAHNIVSSESEELILVDESDVEIGTLSKAACHDGDGVLHRAFSLFIFNGRGELLLQQRSASKRLWPLYWSNSCCSHPRAGESMDVAVGRRLHQELGLRGELEFIYKFAYTADFGEAGSENELCSVFLGRTDQSAVANANEIAGVRYVTAEQLDRELRSEPERFTPWFRMEWERLTNDYANRLARYIGT
ncbi:MAG: isopentenyl-diphosphate Delta-isomerase [Pseudomonadota bacterium]